MKHKGKVLGTSSDGQTFVQHYLKEDGTGHTIAFRDWTGNTSGDLIQSGDQGPSTERVEREIKALQEKIAAEAEAQNKMIPE